MKNRTTNQTKRDTKVPAGRFGESNAGQDDTNNDHAPLPPRLFTGSDERQPSSWWQAKYGNHHHQNSHDYISSSSQQQFLPVTPVSTNDKISSHEPHDQPHHRQHNNNKKGSNVVHSLKIQDEKKMKYQKGKPSVMTIHPQEDRDKEQKNVSIIEDNVSCKHNIVKPLIQAKTDSKTIETPSMIPIIPQEDCYDHYNQDEESIKNTSSTIMESKTQNNGMPSKSSKLSPNTTNSRIGEKGVSPSTMNISPIEEVDDIFTGIEDPPPLPPQRPGAVRVEGINRDGESSSLSPSSIRLQQNESSRTNANGHNTAAEETLCDIVIPTAFLVQEEDGEEAAEREEQRRKKKQWIIIGTLILGAIVASVIAALLGLILLPSSDSEQDTNTDTDDTNNNATQTPSPSATTLPPTSCTFCWTPIGQSILGETQTSRSGTSIALSSNANIVAIGEPGVDRVRVFEWNNEKWTLRGSPLHGPVGSDFGYAVALSDDGRTVAIGGPHWGTFQGTGIVHIYHWMLPHEVWVFLHECKGSVASHYAGMYFGSDVSLSSSGRTLAVAGPYASPRVEIWTSATGNLGSSDSVEYWSQLSSWSSFVGWPDVVSLSGNASIIAVGDKESVVQVLKIRPDNDWEVMGDEIIGSFMTMSKNANVVAVASAIENANFNSGKFGNLTTSVYKWDETNLKWMLWGNQIDGFPVSLTPDGSIIAVVISSLVELYQNREGTWEKISDNIAFTSSVSNVAVARDIRAREEGIVLAVGEPFLEGPSGLSQGRTTVYNFNDPTNGTSPTIPPDNSMKCEVGLTLFRLELKTHLRPEDLSWELNEEDVSDPIAQGGPFAEPLTLYVFEKCLSLEKCFQLRVSEWYQIGICCSSGEGGFTIYLNDQIYAVEDYSNKAYGTYSNWFGNCSF